MPYQKYLLLTRCPGNEVSTAFVGAVHEANPGLSLDNVLINRQLGNSPVLIELLRSIGPDPRHLQIIALASLLAINFAVIDFGARMAASAIAVVACLLAQVVCSRLPA
jgi:hypothetical protein